MSIDDITAKILSDATEHATKLVSDATAEALRLKTQAEQASEKNKESMAELCAKDSLELRHRMHSLAELEARKMRLAAKQQAVAEVIETAVERLSNMEQEEYISLLAKKIAEAGINQGQLLLNERDRKNIGTKLVATANKLLGNGKLTLSEQCINAKGGFVIRAGTLDINSTIETLVHSKKESFASSVVATLFRE